MGAICNREGYNCGGRCQLIAHVQDGRIVRLDADDRPDTIAAPQLRACVRGRSYLRRQYHPDRLTHPLKRIGPRGSGEFQPISWEDVLDTLAAQMERGKRQYGSSALFLPYGTGSYNQLNGSHAARRLMNLYGGCLGIHNSYSWGATNMATPTVYGTLVTSNQRQDWLNSKYILMWGWNPAKMRDGTNSDYFIRLAREAGARVICIDPRHSLSAASLADEWIPIHPGTDAAMMSAIALTILVFLLFQLGIHQHKALTPLHKSRIGFTLIGMTLAVIVAFQIMASMVMLATWMAMFVIGEEVLGRWSFYRSRL